MCDVDQTVVPVVVPGGRTIRLVILLLLCSAHQSAGQESKKEQQEPLKNVLKGKEAEHLVQLKHEVDALETLFHLEPSESQLQGLLALAKQTAAKPKAVAEVTAGPDYRKTLQNLRDALAADAEERIEALNDELAKIHDASVIEIEDEFEITDAAIKAAPAALKLFKAAQVVSYLAALDDEVPDPMERVLLTVSEGEDATEDDWKSLRDETAEEVGWLIHGFDHDAAKKTEKEVSALLDRGHRHKGEALKKEIPVIEQETRKAIGAVSPTVVLQHYMERELAEFLSNPRAIAAMKARMEHAKK